MKDRISIQQVDNGWIVNRNEYSLEKDLIRECHVARTNIEAIGIISRIILGANKLPIEELVSWGIDG